MERLESMAGQWAKWLAYVTAAAYAAGFLVETVYLGSQGFFVVDLLRIQYVFSGYVLFAYLLFPTLVVYRVTRFIFPANRQVFVGRPWSLMGSILGHVGVMAGFSLLGALVLSMLSWGAYQPEVLPRHLSPLETILKSLNRPTFYAIPLVAIGASTQMIKYVWPERGRHRRWLRPVAGALFFVEVCAIALAYGVAAGLVGEPAVVGLRMQGVLWPAFGLAVSISLIAWVLAVADEVKRSSLGSTAPSKLSLPDAVERQRKIERFSVRMAMGAFNVLYGPVLFGMVVTSIWWYSALVFPHLGRAAGGGQLQAVEVVTKTDFLANITKRSSGQLFLIHQTDKYVLLLLRDDRRVLDRIYLPMGSVELIRFLPDQVMSLPSGQTIPPSLSRQ